MDSISSVAYGNTAIVPDVQAFVQREMQQKISELESAFTAKQNEVLEQMQALQKKNEQLEQQVEDRNRSEHRLSFTPTSACGLSATPDTSKKAAPRFSMATPPSASPESVSRSMHRLSMRGPRNSIAHQALAQGSDPQNLAEASAGPLPVQRQWWAEQRSFLLEDLYPHGSPAAGNAARAKKRMSTQAGPIRAVPSSSRRRASEVQSLDRRFEEAEGSMAADSMLQAGIRQSLLG